MHIYCSLASLAELIPRRPECREEDLKGILWQKYKLSLKVVVFIDEIDGETHFAQLGSSWPGEPKMSQK